MNPSLRALLEEVRAILSEDVSKEPYQRAKTRMDDAAKRGGIDKMIQATKIRVNAAEDGGKLQGIVDYIDDLIDQLNSIKSAAKNKL
jgi:hypothetical protein